MIVALTSNPGEPEKLKTHNSNYHRLIQSAKDD